MLIVREIEIKKVIGCSLQPLTLKRLNRSLCYFVSVAGNRSETSVK